MPCRTSAVDRADALGFPLPGVGQTVRAAAERARGDVAAARAHLAAAARGYPHRHVLQNARAFDAWELGGGQGEPPVIEVEPSYDLACELAQPTNPGPID